MPGGVLGDPVLKLGDVVAAAHMHGDLAAVLRRRAVQRRRAGLAWLRAAQRRAHDASPSSAAFSCCSCASCAESCSLLCRALLNSA